MVYVNIIIKQTVSWASTFNLHKLKCVLIVYWMSCCVRATYMQCIQCIYWQYEHNKHAHKIIWIFFFSFKCCFCSVMCGYVMNGILVYKWLAGSSNTKTKIKRITIRTRAPKNRQIQREVRINVIIVYVCEWEFQTLIWRTITDKKKHYFRIRRHFPRTFISVLMRAHRTFFFKSFDSFPEILCPLFSPFFEY